jgi:hypothetical protein
MMWEDFRCYISNAPSIAPILLIIAIVLFLLWLCLVIRRHRFFPILGITVIALAGLSLRADWKYIALNLRLRNVEALRADCMALMDRRQSIHGNSDGTLELVQSELPPSFLRLNAIGASVSSKGVAIALYQEPVSGRCWGYAYCPYPEMLDRDTRWRAFLRPTWYHDFYQFLRLGE